MPDGRVSENFPEARPFDKTYGEAVRDGLLRNLVI